MTPTPESLERARKICDVIFFDEEMLHKEKEKIIAQSLDSIREEANKETFEWLLNQQRYFPNSKVPQHLARKWKDSSLKGKEDGKES